ncbi:hypothetical protein OIU77_004362 [Salix suchowensis]|uniref:Uncharacterized protein n=1 Tax=Salix suchowensis TaxID=1278906 RepID=A0ABQ9AWX5_9ROSI|nr:hypothetical protein OIU77_004362 [Salix suchowensis]
MMRSRPPFQMISLALRVSRLLVMLHLEKNSLAVDSLSAGLLFLSISGFIILRMALGSTLKEQQIQNILSRLMMLTS